MNFRPKIIFLNDLNSTTNKLEIKILLFLQKIPTFLININ